MSWFRVGTQKPDFTGLQLQTSTSTLPIPIVWGVSKLSGNVIFYNNFQTANPGAGKGGLFSSNSSAITYSADLMIALSEGPIAGIGTIWKDQSITTLSGLGLTLYNGATPQSIWGYLSTMYPVEALTYQGTAYVCAASYQLGDNASIGNHNFEVLGLLASSGVNGVDADPAQVIYDFLTNPQYGVGFNAAAINLSTLYGPGGDASLQTYCRALGIAFSPSIINQEPASSIMTRWLQISNCAAVWSQGELKFIPYGDTPINAGNASASVTLAVSQPSTTTSSSGPQTLTVCPPSAFVSDGGVRYSYTGAALTYIGVSSPSAAGQYGISPNGAYLFSNADAAQVVTISYTYAVPVSYIPNLTPIYALNDLDYVSDGDGKDPVIASRVDPFSLPNIQRVEVLSRANQYGATPIEARDQSQIEIYGPRVGTTITAHEICDDVSVAPIVAQAILQRGLYVRSHYTFKLSWEFCLLDPMDIIEITDSNLGLSNCPVRIDSIEEDDKGLLTVIAEELTVGVSCPVLYPNWGPRGYLPNQNVAADPVNAPLIYEPPPALTNNVAQIWIGASGGLRGVADPNWGGANVYVSVDNVSYSQVATLTQKLRQGVLQGTFAAATGWDMIDTLTVNLTESAGALSGASAGAAQQGATLCLVDSELLAYESATLSGPYNYKLSGLQRGMYGSTAAAHAAGTPFARLDSATVKYNLPPSYIGLTLYFKLQSFNIFGAGMQSLANCIAYQYTPTGAGEIGPVASSLALGTAMDWGHVARDPLAGDDDWGSCAVPIYSVIDLGNCTS